MTVYTAMCDEWGCHWQASTEDRAEAERWARGHLPHAVSIIDEEDDGG